MACVSLQARLLLPSFPYTLFVDANTNGAAGLCFRAASSTFTVPPALTSKSVTGSISEVVTATCPARWRIASWFFTWSARAWAFLMSSWTKVVALAWRLVNHLRLRSVPARLKLSSTVTCQPAPTMWSAALTPRKPAPPVIKIRRSRRLVAARAGAESAFTAPPAVLDRRDPPVDELVERVVDVIEVPYLKPIARRRRRDRIGCRFVWAAKLDATVGDIDIGAQAARGGGSRGPILHAGADSVAGPGLSGSRCRSAGAGGTGGAGDGWRRGSRRLRSGQGRGRRAGGVPGLACRGGRALSHVCRGADGAAAGVTERLEGPRHCHHRRRAGSDRGRDGRRRRAAVGVRLPDQPVAKPRKKATLTIHAAPARKIASRLGVPSCA